MKEPYSEGALLPQSMGYDDCVVLYPISKPWTWLPSNSLLKEINENPFSSIQCQSSPLFGFALQEAMLRTGQWDLLGPSVWKPAPFGQESHRTHSEPIHNPCGINECEVCYRCKSMPPT